MPMESRDWYSLKQDAFDAIKALRKLGWGRERILQVIRLHVTSDELDNMMRHYEERRTVSAGTGHIAYAGQPVGLFGIPVVVDAIGEVKNDIF